MTKIGGLVTWLVKTAAGTWGIGVTEFTRADVVSTEFGIETIGLLARRAGLNTDGSVKAGVTGAGAWRFLLGKLTDLAILSCRWGVMVLILPDGVRIGKALTCGTALRISGAVLVTAVSVRGVVADACDGCGVLAAPTLEMILPPER